MGLAGLPSMHIGYLNIKAGGNTVLEVLEIVSRILVELYIPSNYDPRKVCQNEREIIL